MIVRIKTLGQQAQASPAPVERPNFAELEPQGSNRVVAFLASLSLHVVLVWLIVSTVQVVESQMALLEEQEYPMIALQLSAFSDNRPHRLTDPVKSAAPAVRAGQASAARSPVSPGASPGNPVPDAPSKGDKKPAPRGKRFQLPVVTKKPARQILIRADVPPNLELDPKIAVPEVLLWQQALPEKPKTTIITAAHREEEPVRVRETPTVDPKLTAQNREQELADLRQAVAPPVPKPTLPVPVANTTPIRLLDGVPGKKLPNSTGVVVPIPEEVKVISIPDRPVPQAHVIVLPPANQGAPLPSSSSGTNDGAANGGGAGQGSSNGAKPAGAGAGGDVGAKPNQAGSGGAVGASGASGSGGKSNPLSASAATGTGVSPGSASAGTGAPGDTGTVLGPTPPNTTLVLRPRDGKYTVTVLGSSNLDAYPEAAGLLSGKLVYTVYVRAGGRKEWILQYCLPAAAEQSVKLRGSAVPVAAPYPFVIYHPDLPFPNDPEYVIVHGFISVAGRFERLSAIGDIDSASKTSLIGALEHWEFRPAMRDGEPSAVEIALIIPREPG